MSNHHDHHNKNLSKWLWVLRLFCPAYLYEGIEGDLIEDYKLNVDLFGKRKAKRIFIWNALKFFRLGIIFRNRFNFRLINTIMWKSYITVTWRNLLKSKGYFTYHVEISPLVFLIAGIVEFVLALFCVGYLSYRAATLNPAHVLKDE